jgi:hypothetical protein
MAEENSKPTLGEVMDLIQKSFPAESSSFLEKNLVQWKKIEGKKVEWHKHSWGDHTQPDCICFRKTEHHA